MISIIFSQYSNKPSLITVRDEDNVIFVILQQYEKEYYPKVVTYEISINYN